MSSQSAEATNPPIHWPVLLVHRDNQRAIRFYEKCGFELIPGVVRRNHHFVMKPWIGEAKDCASKASGIQCRYPAGSMPWETADRLEELLDEHQHRYDRGADDLSVCLLRDSFACSI